jgi:hypothetical protein
MRFSTAFALCAAPLALAGSIQDSLIGRTEHMAMPGQVEPPKAEASQKEGGKSENNVQVSASTSITQVIIIWVNNGGGATTTTMESAKSAAPPPPSAATHSVGFRVIHPGKSVC